MDHYRTLAEPAPEQYFKEKGSRFFSYAFPIESESEVKPILDTLRKKHPGAVHYCYAWQTGIEKIAYRANDDGEPAHTAGTPIYGQIQSFGLTNVLVVVVRFFGGIKLGVGGLISAYRTSAQMALANAVIEEREIKILFDIFCNYANLNKVMRIIREHRAEIQHQNMELDCQITASVAKDRASGFEAALGSVHQATHKRQ